MHSWLIPVPSNWNNKVSWVRSQSQLTDAQAASPSQTKVGQFQDALFGDQNVGRLHITVQNLVAVDVVEAVHQLLHHLPA